MPLTVGQVTSVFRSYQTQARIAELNKQNNIRTVQQQADRVSVSDKARDLLESQLRDQQTLAEFDIAAPEPIAATTASAQDAAFISPEGLEAVDTVDAQETADVLEGSEAEEAESFDFDQDFKEVEPG